MIHACQRMGNGREWCLCVVCHGRLHMNGCTSRRRAAIDCCEERHKVLALVKGHSRGLDDSSLPMYDPNRPTWSNTQ